MSNWQEERQKIIEQCEQELPDYYRKKRETIEAHFIPSKATPEKARAWLSPSKKYVLVVTPYETSKGCWSYTRGQVFLTQEYIQASLNAFADRASIIDRLKNLLYDKKHQPKIDAVADVKRNYGQFPFAWVEGHADGHDYLVCGEDYQAVTICQLDTGLVKNSADSLIVKGWGWCHASFYAAPNKQLMAASGCVWGGPYDIRFYDFRDPMNLPWPMIESVDDESDSSSWKEDGVFSITKEIEIRKSDGKPVDELTEEEEDALENSEDDESDYKTITIVVTQDDLMAKLENN